MAFPVIPVLAAAAAFFFIAGKKKSGGGDVSGFLMRNPSTGVIQCRPDVAPGLLAQLSSYFASPAPSDSETQAYGGIKALLSQTPGANKQRASDTVIQAVMAGQNVLMAIDGSPYLWIAPPGAEQSVARRFPDEGGRWALLVERAAVPGTVTPSIPAVPGVPSSPAPTAQVPMPGATAPAIFQQNPDGSVTVNVPGVGPMTVPASTVASIPGGIPGPTAPAPTAPPTVPGPTAPGQGELPGGATVAPAPGGGVVVTIPGLGSYAVPGVPGAPSVTPGPAAPVAPTVYTHTLRKGDIASAMAQRYTGSAYRWKELKQTNPKLVIVNQEHKPVDQYGGPAFGFLPWNEGDVLVLPPGWDGSKGPGAVPKYTAMIQRALQGATA